MAPKPTESKPTVEVCCGACEVALDERQDAAVEDRLPCPSCGSLRRLHKVSIQETLGLHEPVRARGKRLGKGGWIVDTRSGDDYTRALEGWGKRELTMDRENDRYRELIVLHDGTQIESTAALRDHHGPRQPN